MRVIGYARASTRSPHSLTSQRHLIEDYCSRNSDLTLIGIEEDQASGKTAKQRPGLAAAIKACGSGRVSAIVVTRVDRLARTTPVFDVIREQLDLIGTTVFFTEQATLDIGSPQTRRLAVFAELEGELISARTKEALQVVRRHGSRSGRPIGNPNFHTVPPAIASRICAMREQGLSYRSIAEALNEQQIPTVQGGRRWYPQTVSNVVNRGDK